MKSEMKAIVASIVVIALALGAFSGVTYSWFSATEKADIDVTAGVVDIELSDMTLKTYSWNGGTYEFQHMAKNGETAGFFNSPDGKGASLTQNTDGSWNIVVDGISDKDYVEIIGDITNKSTINTIYRTTLKCTSGSEDFFNALVSGMPTHTSWAPVAAASDPTVGDKIVEDGLLSKIGLDGYSTGTGATCKIEFAVEAYQANADVDKTVDQLTVKGENTVTIKSIDPNSKLKEATIVFDDPTGGKKVAASEVAVSDSSSYGIPGIVSAGIGLTSAGATDLYKGCKATITMVLDGVYTREQIDVYHGSDPLPPTTTGSETNEITVSSDPSAKTTTVTIVTYDGFSPYFITQKILKATSSSGTSYHYSLDDALAVSPTEIEILYDYDGNSKAVEIKNPVKIYGLDGVMVTDVNFTINVAGKDATVSISNLRMETHSSSQTVEHMVSLKDTNQCRVELDRVEFITGCTYNHMSRTLGAVWTNGGSLFVSNCVFDVDSILPADEKRIALELYNLSSAEVHNCVFNNITRAVNLDGVKSFNSDNNIFNMPESKTTDQKIFNINNVSIDKYKISGNTVNWNDSTTSNMYSIYIYKKSDESSVSEFEMNGRFTADLDVFVPSQKKLVISSLVTIDGMMTVDGTIVLSPSGVLTVSKKLTTMPSSGDGKSVTVSGNEDTGPFTYSVVSDIPEDTSLVDAVNNCDESVSSVKLGDGEYSLNDNLTKDAYILGNGDTTVIDRIGITAHATNLILDHVTIKSGTDNYKGFQHTNSLYVKDSKLTGLMFLYAETVVFTNCTFVITGNNYSIWTYGAKNVVFDNCTFECAGKSVLIYSEDSNLNQTVTFNNCDFKASAKLSGKAAIEVDSSLVTNGKYTVNINDCTVDGFDTGSRSSESLWNEKEGFNTTITVDNVVVWDNGAKVS